MTNPLVRALAVAVLTMSACWWTGAGAAQAVACDPETQVCISPEPMDDSASPTATPQVTVTPRVSVTPTPSASPSPAPGGGGGGGSASTTPGGCGDFWSDPLALGAQCSQPNGSGTTLFGQGGYFQRIANALIFVVGAVSVLMIILGGLRFVVSMGNAKAVTQARDTILYAVIGVVIAFVSFAVVNFVITALAKTT